LPLQHSKNQHEAASKASREQRLRSAGKRANFSAAKNLPFCYREEIFKKRRGGVYVMILFSLRVNFALEKIFW
jgi:hypothetical protein